MGEFPENAVHSSLDGDISDMTTEQLLDSLLAITAQSKHWKQCKARVDAELSKRLRQETGHKIVRDGIQFRLGTGSRVVCDTQGLISYVGDEWPEVFPLDKPRITVLRKIAQRRGEDSDLVIASFLSWKNSTRIGIKYLETKEGPF